MNIFKKIKLALERFDEENARYTLTPKGIAYLCFNDNGIAVDEETFDAFWDEFVERMYKMGYAPKDETNGVEKL